MHITGRIPPKKIRAVRHFPELDSTTEVGVIAWFIFQEAQKEDRWPDRISVATISSVISDAVERVVDFEYTMQVVKAMWRNGLVIMSSDEIILQERFAEELYSKFPSN